MGVSVTPGLSLRTPASPSPPFRGPPSEPFDERHCASCLSQPADPHISLLAFSPVHRFPLRHLVHPFYGGRPIVLTSRAQVPVPPVVVSPPFRTSRLLAHSSGFVVSIEPPVLYFIRVSLVSRASALLPSLDFAFRSPFAFLGPCPALLLSRRSCALPCLSTVIPCTSISPYDYS